MYASRARKPNETINLASTTKSTVIGPKKPISSSHFVQSKPADMIDTDQSMHDCFDDTLIDEHRTTEQSYDS